MTTGKKQYSHFWSNLFNCVSLKQIPPLRKYSLSTLKRQHLVTSPFLPFSKIKTKTQIVPSSVSIPRSHGSFRVVTQTQLLVVPLLPTVRSTFTRHIRKKSAYQEIRSSFASCSILVASVLVHHLKLTAVSPPSVKLSNHNNQGALSQVGITCVFASINSEQYMTSSNQELNTLQSPLYNKKRTKAYAQ